MSEEKTIIETMEEVVEIVGDGLRQTVSSRAVSLVGYYSNEKKRRLEEMGARFKRVDCGWFFDGKKLKIMLLENEKI